MQRDNIFAGYAHATAAPVYTYHMVIHNHDWEEFKYLTRWRKSDHTTETVSPISKFKINVKHSMSSSKIDDVTAAKRKQK